MLSLKPGKPYPLGANFDGVGVNFAVYAPYATHVTLCLFDSPEDDIETRRVELHEQTDQVWHGYVPNLRPGALYGYRVDGPFDPSQGLRHNPLKLLIDPYARGVARTARWSEEIFGYPVDDALPPALQNTRERDLRDSAPFAALGCVIDDGFDWQGDKPPGTPWRDTVVYETQVRGFTLQHPDVPREQRGTYAGLASEAVISHLLRLGVTAVELLPVHHHLDEQRLIRLGLRNYWGYNTLCYFAPEPRFASNGGPQATVNEFKSMVRELHRHGLEVILDVVYNHTCEGNELGPTLNFRGFGESAYYRLDRRDRSRHINYTGVGNTVDTRNPRALQLIADSLRYWAQHLHVDGFRFDLCCTLGRETDGFDPHSGFFDILRQDPALAHVKLIGEPWDIGPGGYQVGRFPPGWGEWNGRYRDDVRRFWKGDSGMTPAMSTRIAGSSDLYNHSGRAPTASVNFVTSHDGFTLNDLVSYNRKRNLANGEGNRDGEHNNNSWNCGAEGPTDDRDVLDLRSRQKRNLLTTLLLSAGTPMLLGGDELSRTQLGNNNAYCQDNEISWFDWRATPEREALTLYIRRLIELRMATPALRRRRFFTGQAHPGRDMRDIAWFAASGHEMQEPEWHDAKRKWFGVLIAADPEGGEPLFWMLNASNEARLFHLPPSELECCWRRVLDSSIPDGGEEIVVRQVRYEVQPHSSVVLLMQLENSSEESE